MKYSLVFLGLTNLVSATSSTPTSPETMESLPSKYGEVPGKFHIPNSRGERSEETVKRYVRLQSTFLLFFHN
jgi:hypothetical protein